MDAALGFRAHSGWAVLVAVGGSLTAPEILDRRRIELVDTDSPGGVQPYHAARELELKAAEKLVRRSAASAGLLGRRELEKVVQDLGKKGYKLVGCGLVTGSGRPPPTLAAVLASHAMVHMAEGNLFREALTQVAGHLELPVTRIRERELLDRGALELNLAVPALRLLIDGLGKVVGPPWRQDEKQATLVAWLALSAGNYPVHASQAPTTRR